MTKRKTAIGVFATLFVLPCLGSNPAQLPTLSEPTHEIPLLRAHQKPKERPTAPAIESMDQVPGSVKKLLNDLEDSEFLTRRKAQLALEKGITDPKSIPEIRDLWHLEQVLKYIHSSTNLSETKNSVQGVLKIIDSHYLRDVPYCSKPSQKTNRDDQDPAKRPLPKDAVSAARDDKWYKYFDSQRETGFGDSCTAAIKELESKLSRYRARNLHRMPIAGIGGNPEPIDEAEDGRYLLPRPEELKGNIGCCKLGPTGPFQTNEFEFVIREPKGLNDIKDRKGRIEYLNKYAKSEGGRVFIEESREAMQKAEAAIYKEDKEEIIGTFEFAGETPTEYWYAGIARPITEARRKQILDLRKLRQNNQ
jgi:hypothetical protein